MADEEAAGGFGCSGLPTEGQEARQRHFGTLEDGRLVVQEHYVDFRRLHRRYGEAEGAPLCAGWWGPIQQLGRKRQEHQQSGCCKIHTNEIRDHRQR